MRADAKKVMRLLKTARGQMDGLIKMVEEDRYCVDISHQLLATQAILRSVNRLVLQGHIEGCLNEAVEKGEAKAQIQEVLEIMDKLAR